MPRRNFVIIVVVADEASKDDKNVALSVLRQVSNTDKAKPYYKKD